MSGIGRGVCAAIGVVLLAWGCASSPQAEPGRTPEEAVADVVTQFIKGMATSNGDQLAATLSPAFLHPEYGDTAAFAEMMRQFTNIRYFEGMTADTMGMTLAVDGPKASAGPAALSGPFGAMVASFQLGYEEPAWRITGVSFQGL